MTSLFKGATAEFIGTFFLVFLGVFVAGIAGAGAGLANADAQGVIVAALGHGLIVLGGAYMFGSISGAHFNPAVTISLLIGRKVSIDKAVVWIVVQIIAAIAAAFIANLLVPGIASSGQTKGALTDSAPWSAALFEALLTFILTSAVWQAAAHGRAGNLAGVAIGLSLAASILAGGLFTGASLNPARTIGPALIAGDLSYLLPYLVGMFGGGVVSALVHGYLLTPDEQ
jgi:aquaporin Z